MCLALSTLSLANFLMSYALRQSLFGQKPPLPRLVPCAPHNTAMWGRGAIRPLSLTTSVALRMFQLNYGSDGTDDGDIAADIMLLCKLF